MKYKNDGKSIYFYENSEVFINKFNVRNQRILTNIETDITMNRLSELSVEPINGRFSFTHLLRIHEYIFADLYPFSGKTRNENISKGTTPFCSCEYIHENYSQLYSQLKRENYLKNLNIIEFSEQLPFTCQKLI